MDKLTVGVVFGSRSTEHDVSIVTALASIIKPLELSRKYKVVPIYISKDGKWYSSHKLTNIKLFTSDAIDRFLANTKPISLSLNDGLHIVGGGLRGKQQKIDIVFPATHGTHGENGEVMAICEMANVPYVGCDMESSVIAMDKILAKQVALNSGINTPKFVHFTKHEYSRSASKIQKEIKDNLEYPMFVKPAHLGSSIGISRVSNQTELINAIEVALHYDDRALVEEGVNNLVEVTLPIIGNEELTPSLLEQPLVHAEDFFDFDTKYMQGGKKGKNGAKSGAQGYSKLPADLPKQLYDQAAETGLAVYRALGCSGISRVDMLIDTKTSKVYFNEVNPLPGDLYAHNWNRAGISKVELVTRLVTLAQERFNQKSSLETAFKTNYLKQF